MYCSSYLSTALVSRAAIFPAGWSARVPAAAALLTRSVPRGGGACLLNANAVARVQPALGTQACRSMTLMSKESAEEFKKTNYSSRMKKLGRPVSPHVTIYAFPVTALSSIMNRVTGCALACGFAGLGGIEIVMGSGSALSLMQTVGSLGFVVATTAKFAVAFPLAFHYMGAMRHFAWDYKPDLLSNQQVEKSSYYVFAAATALSAALALV